MSKTIKCPVCEGTGSLSEPRTTKLEAEKTDKKHAMAKTLIEAGYSYREVADLLGWKSQSSVTHALKKK